LILESVRSAADVISRGAGRQPRKRPLSALRDTRPGATIFFMKRSRELKPLSAEHHQALLVAFQVKKSLEGHPEAAGAPKDLPGLLALARRFEEEVFQPHARAEEELLGKYLTSGDVKRLAAEHAELTRQLQLARSATAADLRAALGAFAELLERHVHWEERELFPYAEDHVDQDALAMIGGELEKRLVLAGLGARSARH
jgi:hemerythrin-like domain-containing protein